MFSVHGRIYRLSTSCKTQKHLADALLENMAFPYKIVPQKAELSPYIAQTLVRLPATILRKLW